jgi:hypothetical protein
VRLPFRLCRWCHAKPVDQPAHRPAVADSEPASENGKFLEAIARWQVDQQMATGTSLDSRLVALAGFDLAAVYFISQAASGPWRWLALIPVTTLMLAAGLALFDLHPRTWKMGPDLTKNLDAVLVAPTQDVERAALDSMARAYPHNAEWLKYKARGVNRCSMLTAGGVLMAVALSFTVFTGGTPRTTTTAPAASPAPTSSKAAAAAPDPTQAPAPTPAQATPAAKTPSP